MVPPVTPSTLDPIACMRAHGYSRPLVWLALARGFGRDLANGWAVARFWSGVVGAGK